MFGMRISADLVPVRMLWLRPLSDLKGYTKITIHYIILALLSGETLLSHEAKHMKHRALEVEIVISS